jgi:hypothetical protein
VSFWGQLNFQEGFTSTIESLNYYHDYVVLFFAFILLFILYLLLLTLYSRFFSRHIFDSHFLQWFFSAVPRIITLVTLLFTGYPSLLLLDILDKFSSSENLLQDSSFHSYFPFSLNGSFLFESFDICLNFLDLPNLRINIHFLSNDLNEVLNLDGVGSVAERRSPLLVDISSNLNMSIEGGSKALVHVRPVGSYSSFGKLTDNIRPDYYDCPPGTELGRAYWEHSDSVDETGRYECVYRCPKSYPQGFFDFFKIKSTNSYFLDSYYHPFNHNPFVHTNHAFHTPHELTTLPPTATKSSPILDPSDSSEELFKKFRSLKWHESPQGHFHDPYMYKGQNLASSSSSLCANRLSSLFRSTSNFLYSLLPNNPNPQELVAGVSNTTCSLLKELGFTLESFNDLFQLYLNSGSADTPQKDSSSLVRHEFFTNGVKQISYHPPFTPR